jgi:hypothetical protein
VHLQDSGAGRHDYARRQQGGHDCRVGAQQLGHAGGHRPTLYRRFAPSMLLKVLYWLAVLAVSLALVIGLILFLESRDQSSIEGAARPAFTSA